jgi:hypothetical protein
MADTQTAPHPATQPAPAPGGSITEAQEALLGIMDSDGEIPEEKLEAEEAQPTEEEESQPEEEDESFEEESEEEDESIEDEEESEESDEIEDDEEEPLFPVMVNGEEVEVTYDELLSGYSRQSDYTRKTQEVSEQRKEFEAMKQSMAQEYQKIQAERQQYVNALQNVIQNSAGEVDKFASVDWEALKNDNPLEYITKRDEYRDAQDRVRQAQFQQQQAYQAHQEESAINHRRAVQSEYEKLVSILPEWNEPDTRQELSSDIKKYAFSQGYTQEEIASLIDHRSLMTLYKAMKFDRASEPNVVKKKVKNKPSVINTGSPRSKSSMSSGKRKAQMKRLQQSGRVDDATRLLEDFVDF